MPDSATDLTISVVVPTYQRRRLLDGVLRPLLADPGVHEVVVVVDGSSDGSAELLAQASAADARVRPVVQANRGLAAARQRGLEEATGDVVLLLDDDVVPGPGLASAHLAAHRRQADPHLVLVGHMPNDPTWVPRDRRAVAEVYSRAYDAAADDWETGADVLLHFWAGHFSLRRDAALRIGFLSPSDAEFRRQEDRDFGMRAAAAGYRGLFDRTLRSAHLFDRTLAAWRRECFRSGEHRAHLHVVHEDLLRRLDDEGTRAPGAPRRAVRAVVRAVARAPFAVRVVDLAALGHHLAARLPGGGSPARLLARAVSAMETQRGFAHHARSSARVTARLTSGLTAELTAGLTAGLPSEVTAEPAPLAPAGTPAGPAQGAGGGASPARERAARRSAASRATTSKTR